MDFLCIAVCGAVSSVSLYRSMCSPYFIRSRMLFWVTLASMWGFRKLTEDFCPHMRVIAGEQFLACALLSMSLVFYHQYLGARPVAVPTRFTIEGCDDEWLAPFVCLWTCIAASMALAIHAAWLIANMDCC